MGVTNGGKTRQPSNPHVLAHKTLEMLESLHLTPTPQAYHVFYVYLNEEDSDLTKLVNILIQNTRDLTDDMVLKVYNKFFGTTRHSTRLVAGVEDLMQAVRRVSTAVEDVIDETGDYSGSLDSAMGRFGDNDITLEEVRSLSKTLLDDTKRMHETGTSFRDSLDQYNGEVTNVMVELEQVRREAMTDALTGIPNRKYFELTLHQAAAEAMETGEPLCLLMLDIDRFKEFNDSHGHRAGDGILKTVSRVLVNVTKGADTVARYGGEEFIILLPNTELDNACVLAENIRKRVANSQVRHKKTGESFGQITVSVGAAQFVFGESLNGFVDRADKALYAAKNAGRNRVERAA